MVRLSIIIPFYNVEQYIAQCLDSVYNQDIPEDEYEVICVNDASPDNSREIVKEYQKKHKNLILVEHEVNRKLGAARNTGRRIARGMYIWNVDSDDMIVPNCLKEMLGTCEKYALDVYVFSLYKLKDGVQYERGSEPWMKSNSVYTGLTFWKQQVLKCQHEISPVWTQMYRRDYLDENNILSPEINMGEDVPYTYASILLAGRLMACNHPYYIYRDSSNSLTKIIKNAPKPHVVYENSFVCGKIINDIIQHISPLEQDIIRSIQSVERYIVLLYVQDAQKMGKNDKYELARMMRKNVLKNTFVFKMLGLRKSMQYIRFMLSGKIAKE